MISELNPPIKGLILDLDGVLWKDHLPLGNIPKLFDRFQKLNYGIILATNNATKDIDEFQEKLLKMGAPVELWQIVNSGMAVSFLLERQHPNGGPVYIVGEQGLHHVLAEKGFYHSSENPLAVVAGLDRELTYQKIEDANRIIRSGVPFIGTNPDRTFPTPKGLVPGAGTVLAAIEAASYVKPIIAGKPESALFLLALERLGISPTQALAVGDRLDTDILGGIRSGCRTALVFSGVTTPADLEQSSIKPDLTADSLWDLVGAERT